MIVIVMKVVNRLIPSLVLFNLFVGLNFSNSIFAQEKQVSDAWIRNCIVKNRLSGSFLIDTIEFKNVIVGNDLIEIKFLTRESRMDTACSHFSGFIENDKFFFSGPFIWCKQVKENLFERFLGNIERDQIHGFVVGLEGNTNRISSVSYYSNGTPTGISMAMKNGKLTEIFSTDTTFQTGQLKLGFDMNGILGSVSFERNLLPSGALLSLNEYGYLEFFGSYSDEYVFITFFEDKLHYLFQERMYETPWEFVDDKQAEYIQNSSMDRKVVPLRTGGWFYSEEKNQIRTELYDNVSTK